MTDKLKIVIEITNTGLEEDILRKGEWEDDSLFGRSLRNALMQFTKGNEWIVDILDNIRAEVTAIDVSGQVDEHTMFINTGEQVKQVVLEIIDKYKEEVEQQEGNEKG